MDSLRRQRLTVASSPSYPLVPQDTMAEPATKMNAVAFVGSPHRTRAHRLVGEIVATLGECHGIEVRTLDLTDAGPGLCALSRTALDPQSLALVRALENCDALIVGCPVFQGSYPGLFKHVFDLIGPTTLRNKPVLLSAVGGGLRHSLVVEHQLRPLFGFFEASTISTAVYACADEIDAGSALPDMLRARILNAAHQFAAQLNNPILTTTGACRS